MEPMPVNVERQVMYVVKAGGQGQETGLGTVPTCDRFPTTLSRTQLQHRL